MRLYYALTIHKSHGQTINKAVIDLGKKEMTLCLTFIALTRLKKFKDFIIKPFTMKCLNKISQSTSFKTRLEEKLRISGIIDKTILLFLFFYNSLKKLTEYIF